MSVVGLLGSIDMCLSIDNAKMPYVEFSSLYIICEILQQY